MRFDSEKKKLQFIKRTLLREENLRIADNPPYISPPHCRVMMKDLLEGKNFEAIEPDVRAGSMDDPRLEKWNQCRGKDYHDFPDVDVRNFFGWLPQLGEAPYRYYRIELNGNEEDGLEDMIYAEGSDEVSDCETAYTWVNLQKCEIKGFYPVTGSRSHLSLKPNAIYLNLLLNYKGKLWILNFVDGFDVTLMSIGPQGMEPCRWLLFKPD
jgi:hypothetical protein